VAPVAGEYVEVAVGFGADRGRGRGTAEDVALERETGAGQETRAKHPDADGFSGFVLGVQQSAAGWPTVKFRPSHEGLLNEAFRIRAFASSN
jgi:hypothetical protein